MDDKNYSEHLSQSANSSFEETNLKKAGLKTLSAEKSANDLNSYRLYSLNLERKDNECQDLVRNDFESEGNCISNKNLDNGKFKSSGKSIDKEVINDSKLYKFFDKLINIVHQSIFYFKDEYEQMSNIISIFQKFKSLKPNKKTDFLQNLNIVYGNAIIYLEIAKKCKINNNTIFECFPLI